MSKSKKSKGDGDYVQGAYSSDDSYGSMEEYDDDEDEAPAHWRTNRGRGGFAKKAGAKGKGKGGSSGGRGKTSKFAPAADPLSIFQDYTNLTLKVDHVNRPIWITPESIIYLEAFSPHYQGAYDFLVAIGEPVSRPKFIHTYRLTEDSLYAAVALSIDTDKILRTLSRLCKTEVPSKVREYVRDCTYTFGKAKLVLKENKFHIESQFPEVLRELLKNPIIKAARSLDDEQRVVSTGEDTTGATTTSTNSGGFIESTVQAEDVRNLQYMMNLDGDGSDDDDAVGSNAGKRTVSFMIKQERVQEVKRSAKEDSRYPLMEEYDFKGDKRNATLQIDLKASTRIRPYQEKSLSKMFGNGRARSGIIYCHVALVNH